MIYVDIVIALVAIQFLVFGMQVGAARGRYGIKAPATSGHDVFDRYFRVQQNSLESLVVFLPGLYLFSGHVSADWAAALGVLYLIGRQLYAIAYVKNPSSRGPGYAISMGAAAVLLGGGLAMACWHAIH